MANLSGLVSPLLLGFEELERIADRLRRQGSDGYPPYNIEKIPHGDGVILRISLAVAGFSEDDLDIVVEGNELRIGGTQSAADGREFLYRGIAARQFRKQFLLAEGLEVAGASLENGLLSIDLTRPNLTSKPKKIAIGGKTSSQTEKSASKASSNGNVA